MLSFLRAGLGIGVLIGHPYFEPIYFYVEHADRLVSYLIILGLTTKLRTLHDQEKESARFDNLTGVLNQKGFYEALAIEMKRHRREQAALSFAYIDCDNFKLVNDLFGHKEGDRLLAQVAQIMRSTLRETDVLARLGGDEFAVLLVKSDPDQAVSTIEKLRKNLDAYMALHEWPVTFSIGLGIFPVVPNVDDEIVSFSDQLMYQVKSSGKNGVLTEIFEPLSTIKLL